MIYAGALDPSATATETSDYKAWVVLAKEAGKPEVYTVDAWIRRASPEEVIRRIWVLQQTWPAIVIGAEMNGFQRLYMKLYTLMCDIEKRRPLRIVPLINRTNKVDRILTCQAEFELGRCFFDPRQGDQQRLIDQFLDLPKGKHDDGPDAWEMARRLLERAERSGAVSAEGDVDEARHRRERVAATMEPTDGWDPVEDEWLDARNDALFEAID